MEPSFLKILLDIELAIPIIVLFFARRIENTGRTGLITTGGKVFFVTKSLITGCLFFTPSIILTFFDSAMTNIPLSLSGVVGTVILLAVYLIYKKTKVITAITTQYVSDSSAGFFMQIGSAVKAGEISDVEGELCRDFIHQKLLLLQKINNTLDLLRVDMMLSIIEIVAISIYKTKWSGTTVDLLRQFSCCFLLLEIVMLIPSGVFMFALGNMCIRVRESQHKLGERNYLDIVSTGKHRG